MSEPTSKPEPAPPKGLEHAGVIDFLGFDPVVSEVLLVMVEQRPWRNVGEQLFQLQEKLNAYLSFALDGEMTEAYPQFLGKALKIRLECAEPPVPEALGFLQHVYEQSALQGITFEVEVVTAGTCGCGQPLSECGES
ncbi:MAG: hypothetical protein DVB28_002037 [Verrucomicrobia bacterium]|nr:MAG: hypothetical protein DVB28_002037 [Verrucomicrobiota bacterium]